MDHLSVHEGSESLWQATNCVIPPEVLEHACPPRMHHPLECLLNRLLSMGPAFAFKATACKRLQYSLKLLESCFPNLNHLCFCGCPRLTQSGRSPWVPRKDLSRSLESHSLLCLLYQALSNFHWLFPALLPIISSSRCCNRAYDNKLILLSLSCFLLDQTL